MALESVLEVGCGAGHDGRLIRAGLAYTGVDLSAVGVGLCAGLSLHAVQASAINLPFRNRSFDAGWTMSTLMHLPGNDINVALNELGRVIRPGGLLEVGVWARMNCIAGSTITAAISDSGPTTSCKSFCQESARWWHSKLGTALQTPAVTTNGLGYR
jgi:SAM-dependent methyltransferase